MKDSSLIRQLLNEADRRAALGHWAPAHDLRRAAGDVRTAQSRLESSKEVRKP